MFSGPREPEKQTTTHFATLHDQAYCHLSLHYMKSAALTPPWWRDAQAEVGLATVTDLLKYNALPRDSVANLERRTRPENHSSNSVSQPCHAKTTTLLLCDPCRHPLPLRTVPTSYRCRTPRSSLYHTRARKFTPVHLCRQSTRPQTHQSAEHATPRHVYVTRARTTFTSTKHTAG
jgi:hypothetical protein